MTQADEADDAVVDALRALKADRSTENAKGAAEAIARRRALLIVDGLPDWGGESKAWRVIICDLYDRADIPPDSEGGFQANLRYHVGNAVHAIAPVSELRALGLDEESPLERARKARGKKAPEPRDSRDFAEAGLRNVRDARKAGVTAASADLLVKIIKEAAAALGSPPPVS